ncbi:hypothetical protein TNCT_532041 [Trichonephila clavata]|uniref:Uncharacterized protein n=1 Tax=Trichonephila clavata TaxID=2740835 RepID=A0A8X6M2I1_TRICU|nr:hypothetical protein TNCT_532041 [Trichonephila clavata]
MVGLGQDTEEGHNNAVASSGSGRRASMTSIENGSRSERTDDLTKTSTAGLGACSTSPSQIPFGDEYVTENSVVFRETIKARNVYAA